MDSLNNRIAKIFSKIADSLEILDENRFKINAYRKASRNISSMTDSLEDFHGREANSPRNTGSRKRPFEKNNRVPPKNRSDSLLRRGKEAGSGPSGQNCLEIRGVGPKLLQTLIKRFGVTDIEKS